MRLSWRVQVEEALVASGLPKSAINLVTVPPDLGLFDEWTHFETVLRLFRFENQTQGDAYLKSYHPVYHITASHGAVQLFPARAYTERAHPGSVSESRLEAEFTAQARASLAKVGQVFDRDVLHPLASGQLQAVKFAPLMIRGLDCLKSRTECLGDCPDAAYFGPHIHEDTDDIEMLSLPTDNELHVIALVNHRLLNSSTYGSVALLTGSGKTLSKTRMSVRATSIGVTSFDFPTEATFVSWAFTRNPDHCTRLAKSNAVDGCTVVREEHVPRGGYLTYCERACQSQTLRRKLGDHLIVPLPLLCMQCNARLVLMSLLAPSLALPWPHNHMGRPHGTDTTTPTVRPTPQQHHPSVAP